MIFGNTLMVNVNSEEEHWQTEGQDAERSEETFTIPARKLSENPPNNIACCT